MITLGTWPNYLGQYGYAIVFLASLVEGPIVTVVAGFLASQGVLSVAAVYVTVVLGDLAGDALYYAVGRWGIGRLPWTGRHGGRLRRRIDALREYIRARPGRVLLFGKLTHSAGFAVLLAAGAARVRPVVYMLYNLLGTLIKSAALVLVGYFLGRFYAALRGDLRLAWVIGLLLAVLATAVVARHLWAARDLKDIE